jgi:hypothetical protein
VTTVDARRSAEPVRRRTDRRAVLGALLLSGVSVVVMLGAYYAAPLDRPLDRSTGLLLGAALVLFAVLAAVQVRGILRSRRPRMRAIQALIIGVPLLIVLFAATYCTVDGQLPGSFTEPLDRTDGLYFTVTVFATVGFGDIAPVTQLARVLVTIQMITGLLTVGVIAKVLFGAVQVAVSRRDQQLTTAAVPRDEEL